MCYVNAARTRVRVTPFTYMHILIYIFFFISGSVTGYQTADEFVQFDTYAEQLKTQLTNLSPSCVNLQLTNHLIRVQILSRSVEYFVKLDVKSKRVPCKYFQLYIDNASCQSVCLLVYSSNSGDDYTCTYSCGFRKAPLVTKVSLYFDALTYVADYTSVVAQICEIEAFIATLT